MKDGGEAQAIGTTVISNVRSQDNAAYMIVTSLLIKNNGGAELISYSVHGDAPFQIDRTDFHVVFVA